MNKIYLIAIAIAFVVAIPMFANMPAAHSASSPTLSIAPLHRVISTRTGNFNLTIHVDNVSNLWSWKIQVTWDPTVLTLTNNPIEGSFMNSVASTWFVVSPPRTGHINEMSDSFTSTTGVNGTGDLAYLTFAAVNASNYNYATGGSQVNITATAMLDQSYNNITYTTINSTVHVALVGDVTGTTANVPDGKCDIRDISFVAKHFGEASTSPNWNPNCDINSDGKVDIRDISLVAKNFGLSA